MILSARCEPTEMVPPKVWAQLKHLFVSQAALYGVHLKISEDPVNLMALEARYFEWVEEEASKLGK